MAECGRTTNSGLVRAFVATFALLAALSVIYIYGASLTSQPIRSDGFGYYIYLPAAFIEKDLSFEKLPEHAEVFDADLSLPLRFGRARLNKYTVGVAVMQAPFFLLADALTVVTGRPRNGVSFLYQAANVVSGIVYGSLGAAIVLWVLLREFSPTTAVVTAAAATYATPVFHYTTYDGSFSHIYSFFLVAALVWTTLLYRQQPSTTVALGVGLLLGMITIVRIPNAVLAIVPLAILLESRWLHKQCATRTLADVLTAALGLAVPIIVQLAYWHYATGNWVVYSYGHEGFAFAKPEFANFLFSVRKGLFFWAPILILAVAGFFCLPQHLRVFGIASVLALSLLLYLCASWHQWWFGGSFGSRPFVDVTPLLALPLAAAFEAIYRRSGAWPLYVISGIAILVCTVLAHSYWLGLIPFDGTSIKTLAGLPAAYWSKLSAIWP